MVVGMRHIKLSSNTPLHGVSELMTGDYVYCGDGSYIIFRCEIKRP